MPPPDQGPSLSVVMPAHNEEAYLADAVERTVAGLSARGYRFEILMVENGSTDATAEVGAALAERWEPVRLLRIDEADYGRAVRAGFLAASGDMVVNFDVDLVDLGFVDAACKEAERRLAAIVVGSKRLPGAEDRRPLARRLVTAVFATILRVGFGLGVSDTHGLKLLRREPLRSLAERCLFGADIFDTELILRAERLGLTVVEIPVTIDEQRPPRTPIARRIPRTLLGLGRLRLALWTRQGAAGRRRPPAGP